MNEAETKVVVFEVAGQRFAAFMEDVVEVVRAATISRLPKAPAAIEGILNLRGAVIPVLDIRARFGFAERALRPSDQLVIVRTGERTAALRVDRVIELALLDHDDIQEAREILRNPVYIAGVAKLPDGLVLIFDLPAFLSEAEAQALSRALAEISTK